MFSKTSSMKWINDTCSQGMENSQLNQETGFYVMETLVIKRMNKKISEMI